MEKLGISFKNLDTIALMSKKADKTETINYKDLLKEIMKVTVVIEEFSVPKKSTIAILDRKNFTLVALTMGILEAGFPFCYVNEKELRTDLIDYNSRYVFSEKQLSDLKLCKIVKICGKEIYLYQLDIVRDLKVIADDESIRLCYAIKTSGSCGKKKTVHVTYNSIIPNITSMQRIFQLQQNDIILSMSQITFDPFIVDLFLALHANCTLMFIDDSLRFQPIHFSKNNTLESTGVTYMQITPTLFQQFGIENIQQKILNANSSLK